MKYTAQSAFQKNSKDFKPLEDFLICDEENGVFVVTDGVSQAAEDYEGLVGKSDAGMAAEIAARAVHEALLGAENPQQALSDGVREAIAAMLPAIDNLERAIEAAEKTDDESAKALAEGVRMTLNTLMESLKRFGFEEVPALGEEFDPEKHNAVMREVGDEPGKVLEVFQKGYKVKDKIIRYAMVKVAVEE
jgi:hypothetical protein